MTPSLLNMAEDSAYYRGLEIGRLEDMLALEKLKVETTAAKNESLETEVERLRKRLTAIAEHPDTPDLIKQYARGDI